jgi:tetratricopeptide (TPR) repeat protein
MQNRGLVLKPALFLSFSKQQGFLSNFNQKTLANLLSELERLGKELLHAMELRRYDLAKDIAERILVLNPDHALAHARLGTMLAVAGNKSAAVEKLSYALKLDPNDVYPTAMKGWIAFTDGKLDESLKAYREADAIEPRDSSVNLRISQIYIQMRRLDKAEAQLRELVSLDTDSAEAFHLLASVLRDLKRADEAIPFAERAVELTSSRNVQYSLGLIDSYLQTGKERKASELARQLLKQSENMPQALPQEVLLQLRKLSDP